MSFFDMAIGKKGYCLVPGHPVEHTLTLDCWSEMRRFVYTTEDYAKYVTACKAKSKK